MDKGGRNPLWVAPDAVINEHVKEVIEGDLDGFAVGHPHAGVQPLVPQPLGTCDRRPRYAPLRHQPFDPSPGRLHPIGRRCGLLSCTLVQ